ncbi:Uncharacterised protein [Actinomyces bovis]|uniref:Uncharacterized protein n=1 Tax=Actinomyces bovis TaxID=1658 RepID=A0ABY1VMY4_9ACTO|nr:hypothetical protein [Actinomyces bovis]SPT53464.1 Uncharacterised protein [Actinomyces bovis]VEG55328.1 Uncharacterised protein [Actinomyces israelii]
MPVTTEHEWVVTGGNHPDEQPYYCPLICQTFEAAKTSYHRLIHEPATGFAAQMASMAAQINAEVDEEDATFWYRLLAIAESSWRLVTPESDPARLLSQARSELTRTPIEHHGRHLAIIPAPPQDIITTCKLTWCVTTAQANPNDPRTWSDSVNSDGLTTLKAAQDAYLSMADQLQGVQGMELPTDNISFWQSLQLTATTPWMPHDVNLNPNTLVRDLLTSIASQPPK